MGGDDWVAWSYGLCNGLRLLSYAPQLWCVARDRSGAHAISCISWGLWTAANATTALYAWARLHDWPLAAINLGNAVCCAAVIVLTLLQRARFRAHLRSCDDAPARAVTPDVRSRAVLP